MGMVARHHLQKYFRYIIAVNLTSDEPEDDEKIPLVASSHSQTLSPRHVRKSNSQLY